MAIYKRLVESMIEILAQLKRYFLERTIQRFIPHQ